MPVCKQEESALDIVHIFLFQNNVNTNDTDSDQAVLRCLGVSTDLYSTQIMTYVYDV